MATRSKANANANAGEVIDTPARGAGTITMPEGWQMQVGGNRGSVTSDVLGDNDDDDPEQSVIDRIRALTASVGADRMKVKVYRQKANKTGLEFCADYGVAEFEAGDLAMIRDQWGPGDYQIRVIGAQGVAMRENVSVAAPLIRMENPAPREPSELSQLLRVMAEGQTAILAALSNRPDPGAEMQKTFALMAGMREAMGLNAAPAPAAAAVNPSSMLSELVGAIRQLREVSDEISPKAAPVDTDNPMAMLPQVLDLVKMGMANRGAGQTAAPMPGVMLPPSFDGGAGVAENPIQQSEGEDMGILVMRGLLMQLLELAAKDAPVETGAEFIADKLPDELLQFVELPNWFEILSKFAPQCNAHKAWLTLARDRAIVLLNEDDSGDEPAPVGGLPSNP